MAKSIPNKPKHLYRFARRNKHNKIIVYWRSVPPGLDPEMRRSDFLTQEIVDWANQRNGQAHRMVRATVGTFQYLADVYRGVPVYGVTPSKSQVKADPVRYGRQGGVVEASQQWRDLEPRTRKDYTRYVDKLVKRFGKFPVADFDEETAVELRDSLRETPRSANYILNVLSAMFGVALERPSKFGLTRNPLSNVNRLGVKAGVRPRQDFWTYEHELRFLEDAEKTDPVIADMEFLLAFTGQRPGDCRRMKDTDYDGEKVKVVQSKTGARVWIPCHPKLRARLERNMADARSANLLHFTFIRGLRGAEIGERYLATRWDRIAERTGTLHLNRQDLRRTAVIRLAEAGCSEAEIGSITGHSMKTISTLLATYLVTTYEMARNAIAKLEAHQLKQSGNKTLNV